MPSSTTKAINALEQRAVDGIHTIVRAPPGFDMIELIDGLRSRVDLIDSIHFATLDLSHAQNVRDAGVALTKSVKTDFELTEQAKLSAGRLGDRLSGLTAVDFFKIRFEQRSDDQDLVGKKSVERIFEILAKRDGSEQVNLVITGLSNFMNRHLNRNATHSGLTGMEILELLLQTLKANVEELDDRLTVMVFDDFGLPALLERYQISKLLSYLYVYWVKGWTRHDGELFLSAKADSQSVVFKQKDFTQMCTQLGFLNPRDLTRYLRCVSFKVQDAGRKEATKVDVQTVFEQELLVDMSAFIFPDMVQRLTAILGDPTGEIAARLLIDAAFNRGTISSERAEWISRETSIELEMADDPFGEAIDLLTQDCYLEDHGESFKISSRLFELYLVTKYRRSNLRSEPNTSGRRNDGNHQKIQPGFYDPGTSPQVGVRSLKATQRHNSSVRREHSRPGTSHHRDRDARVGQIAPPH